MLLDVLGLERASSMLAWSILSSHAVQALVEVDVVRSTSGQPYSLSANHPLRGLDDHLHGKGEGQCGDCAAGHDSYCISICCMLWHTQLWSRRAGRQGEAKERCPRSRTSTLTRVKRAAGSLKWSKDVHRRL